MATSLKNCGFFSTFLHFFSREEEKKKKYIETARLKERETEAKIVIEKEFSDKQNDRKIVGD